LLSDFDVLMFDFRGHGKSSGFLVGPLRRGWIWRQSWIMPGKNIKTIGLVGFSFGAAIGSMSWLGLIAFQAWFLLALPSECGKIDYRFWELGFG